MEDNDTIVFYGDDKLKILSKMIEKSQVSAVEALEEVCANTSIENLQQAIRTIDPKTCTDSTTDKKLKSCSLYFVKNMDKVKTLHDALGGFIEGAQSSLMFVLDEASSQAERSFDLGKFRDLMEKAVSFKMGQQSQSLPSSVQHPVKEEEIEAPNIQEPGLRYL